MIKCDKAVNSYHFKILELLKRNINKHWNKLWTSTVNSGDWLEDHTVFNKHLNELENAKYIALDQFGNYYLTDKGKLAKKCSMVDENTLLKYFYKKKDQVVTTDDIFKDFHVFDFTRPFNYLKWNDWLHEFENANSWIITDEGKQEYERRQKTLNPHPINSFVITGDKNVINTGLIEGDLNNNIKNLNELGLQMISKSIQDLVQAIKSSSEITEDQKGGYFETLKVLSAEALKPKENRLPPSTLKQIIQYGLGTLNAFSSISTITGVTLTDISEYS